MERVVELGLLIDRVAAATREFDTYRDAGLITDAVGAVNDVLSEHDDVKAWAYQQAWESMERFDQLCCSGDLATAAALVENELLPQLQDAVAERRLNRGGVPSEMTFSEPIARMGREDTVAWLRGRGPVKMTPRDRALSPTCVSLVRPRVRGAGRPRARGAGRPRRAGSRSSASSGDGSSGEPGEGEPPLGSWRWRRLRRLACRWGT